jgi:sugar phosphate isomerase/epimerase
MTIISRRQFSFGASLSLTRALQAAPLGLPVGCQTYPVRQEIGKNFDGTLKKLAGIGFRTIEMCSPPGYDRAGYGPLVTMPAKEMRERIGAAGMGCESCHYQFRELKESLEERLAYAKDLGLKQIVVSTFSLRNAPLAEWARAAQDLNKIGEKIAQAGLQAAFHNHNVEFTQLEGELIYDRLLKEFDPKLVKMQFQVWVVSLGVDAAALLEKNAGRISSLHLQDYSPATNQMTAIGKGAVDWKKLFASAKKAGVKNYFVEMELDLMAASYPYLRDLKV